MTLFDILCLIRARLLNLIAQNNPNEAEELFTTLSVLRELSYEGKNEALTMVIVDLLDSARDIATGLRGSKSAIPSVENIRAVFTPSSEAS
jgi:hypothetical protein